MLTRVAWFYNETIERAQMAQSSWRKKYSLNWKSFVQALTRLKAAIPGFSQNERPQSKEPHLEFFRVKSGDLEEANLQPYALVDLLTNNQEIAFLANSMKVNNKGCRPVNNAE